IRKTAMNAAVRVAADRLKAASPNVEAAYLRFLQQSDRDLLHPDVRGAPSLFANMFGRRQAPLWMLTIAFLTAALASTIGILFSPAPEFDPLDALIAASASLIAVVAHELGHAAMALRSGRLEMSWPTLINLFTGLVPLLPSTESGDKRAVA